jgi:hypothetical protein
MEVCYWALLFMPLVILHHLLNVFVQLANKRGFTQKKKKKCYTLLADTILPGLNNNIIFSFYFCSRRNMELEHQESMCSADGTTVLWQPYSVGAPTRYQIRKSVVTFT